MYARDQWITGWQIGEFLYVRSWSYDARTPVLDACDSCPDFEVANMRARTPGNRFAAHGVTFGATFGPVGP